MRDACHDVAAHALQETESLAADGYVVALDTLGAPLLVLLQHQSQHIGIEAAAQALVGGDDDGAHALDDVTLRRNGWWYSALALAMCITILNVRSTYGRVARIRSWAFFIFEAETISIALVILRVLCTLLILVVIALELGMFPFPRFPPKIDWLCQRFLGN